MVGASVDELLQQQQEEIDRLGLLVEAAGRLLATLDLDEVLPQVLDLAKQTLTADGYALWRRQADGEWSLQAVAGLSEAYVAASQEAIKERRSDLPRRPDRRRRHRRDGLAERGPQGGARGRGQQGFSRGAASPPRQRDRHARLLLPSARARSRSRGRGRQSQRASLAAAGIGTTAVYEEQARLAEDRRLVAEASELLGSSLDYEATLAHVAQLAVPTFADWCAIDMVAADGSIQRLTTAHADPAKVRFAEELTATMPPPDPDAPQGVPNVIRTQQAELYPEITDEDAHDALANSGLLETIRALGLRRP